MAEFTLPKDAKTYTASVLDRCSDLIKLKMWDGIENYRLEKWINNFQTPEERYFAACLLDNFIYRSNEQTESLIFQLFSKSIPNTLRRFFGGFLQNEILEHLRSSYSSKVRLVLVINKQNSLTKSSNWLGRLLKRKFQINENWIITPWEIKSEVNNGAELFIFIDDFLGTGTQFCDTISKNNVINESLGTHIIYAPLIAHNTGIEKIKKEHKSISVTYSEYLSKEVEVFNNSCNCFNDGVNTPKGAKKFYYDMLIKYNINYKGIRRGYGDLELAIAFEHAAQDNSLLIFWYHKDQVWSSLVDR